MRFSGLNKKTDIPSKAFMKLNQLSVNDTQDSSVQSQCNDQGENKQGNGSRHSLQIASLYFIFAFLSPISDKKIGGNALNSIYLAECTHKYCIAALSLCVCATKYGVLCDSRYNHGKPCHFQTLLLCFA